MNLNILTNYFTPSSILDIGANMGHWALEAKQHFPDAYILSIEANINCENGLKINNPNYIIALLAAEDREYVYWENDHPTSTGNSIYLELTEHFTEDKRKEKILQGRTLNTILPEHTFDLIKMDVQGAELDIIKGGLNIIKQAKGLILEVAHKEYNQGAPLHDEIVSYLESIGFRKAAILDDLWYKGEIYHQDILFLNENTLHN